MGNFTRRTLAFILGFVFAFVILFGGIIGGAYWAFKNLTLGTLNVGEEGSDISSWTIEDLTAFIIDVTKDPNSFTLSELEKHGFDCNEILTSMGVDVESANPKDIQSFKSLAIASLFNETGVYSIDMGIVFLFMPKDPATDKYQLFSEGARNRLRQFSLGDLINPDENGNLGAYSVLRGMKLGSLLSSNFDEVFENGNYTYSSEDRGLNLLGNVELGLITNSLEGNSTDLGYEIKEGYLMHLKDMQLREIIASFGATTEEQYQQNYEAYETLGDKTLDEIIVWNEEKLWYELDVSKIIALGTIGSMMGYEVCSMDENCPIHESVDLCDGELYENGVLCEDASITRKIMQNLCDIKVLDLLGGFDFNKIFDGVYLGGAFGYEQSSMPESCPTDCEEEHEHVYYNYCSPDCEEEHEHNAWEYCQPNCNEEHEHDFYFVDQNGDYVGNMYNVLSNFSFIDAMNGNLNLNDALGNFEIGEIIGYEKCLGNQNCSLHGSTCTNLKTTWYKDGDIVTGVTAKISDLTIDGIKEGGIDSVVDSLVLSDVVDNYSTGSFSIMDTTNLDDANQDGNVDAGDCPLAQIAERVADGAKGASYEKLETAGVLEFDGEVKAGLNQLYDGTSWMSLTINQILIDVINEALS